MTGFDFAFRTASCDEDLASSPNYTHSARILLGRGVTFDLLLGSMTTFTGFFPALEPSTSYSFYNHPLSSRSNVHQTIRGVQPMHAQGSQPVPLSNPGPTTEEIRREARARHRTEKRALVGKRPAGTWLGKEAEELSEEEEAFEDENVSCPARLSAQSTVFFKLRELKIFAAKHQPLWASIPITIWQTADSDGSERITRASELRPWSALETVIMLIHDAVTVALRCGSRKETGR